MENKQRNGQIEEQ